MSTCPKVVKDVREMSIHKVDPNSPLPRYYQVYSSLKERIQSGEFLPGDALPSERQLVQDYGVSRITIVKSVDLLVEQQLIERQHGRGNFVTKPQISIDEPERLKIAIFFPYVLEANRLFGGFLKGIGGKKVQLQIVGFYEPNKEPWYVHNAMERGIEGFIFFPVHGFDNSKLYQELLNKQIPFVMVDRFYPQLNTDYIIFDDFDAGYKLTDFLIQQGHKKIAILTSHEVTVTSIRARLQGYQKALEDNGVFYDEKLVWLDVYRDLDMSPASVAKIKLAYRNLHKYIEDYQPTALIAINRNVHEQLVQDLLKIRKERNPETIGDTGVDEVGIHIDVAALTNVPPSFQDEFTVALALQSDELLGETAMKLLIDRIQGNFTGAPVSKKLAMEIVDLGSILKKNGQPILE